MYSFVLVCANENVDDLQQNLGRHSLTESWFSFLLMEKNLQKEQHCVCSEFLVLHLGYRFFSRL